MAFTIPQIVYPLTLDSDDGPHLTVTHVDHTDYDVTLGSSSGTDYYADGQATDFLDTLETALNAAITDGGTWVVAWVGSGLFGRVSLTKTGGTKTVQEISFNHASLTGHMLGLTATTGTGAVTLTSEAITGSYRVRWMFTPDTIATRFDPEPIYTVSSPQGPTGWGRWDVWGVYEVVTLHVPQLWGALAKVDYAADADHAGNVTGLTTGDANAPFLAWFDHLRLDKSDSTYPTLRYAGDRDTPATYENTRLNDEDTLKRPASALAEVTTAPLQYALTLPLARVPS